MIPEPPLEDDENYCGYTSDFINNTLKRSMNELRISNDLRKIRIPKVTLSSLKSIKVTPLSKHDLPRAKGRKKRKFSEKKSLKKKNHYLSKDQRDLLKIDYSEGKTYDELT